MAHDSGDEKQQAHQLIDRLPPTQLSAVIGLLESMLDPVSHAIANVSLDEEPENRSGTPGCRRVEGLV